MDAGRTSLPRAWSSLRRLAVVALPVVIFASCNDILGIGEPKDPPDETGGRGGNAGSQKEQGGESGDSSGGAGGSRTGGSSGSPATGGIGVGGSGEGGGGVGAGNGGDGGEDAGNGGVGGAGEGNGGVSGAGEGNGGVSGSGESNGGVSGAVAGGGGVGGAVAGSAGLGAGAGSGGVGGAGAGNGGVGGAGSGGAAGVAGVAGNAGAAGAGTTDCDPDAPFGQPVRLPLNDEMQRIFFARLTDDELTMVFQDINMNLWIADRASTTEDFTLPREMGELNTESAEWAPTLTGDGLTVFFERYTGVDAILVATRKNRVDTFSEPIQVPSLDNAGGPYVTPDGQAMYMHAPGGVFSAERRSGFFVFGPRSDYAGLSSPNVALSPVVSADELTIYFSSQRSTGFGGSDIYRARRSNRTDPFGEAQHVSELNSGLGDGPSWISRDNCTIYMQRVVMDSGTAVETIFTARRAPPM